MFRGRLTNLLLWLAAEGAFEPVWSDEIHAEWSRNLAASNLGIPRSKIERRRAEMERAFSAANCAPDPGLTAAVQAMCHTPAQRKDAHVVATAVKSEAAVIVTDNIKDFAPAVIQHYGIAKTRPDAFCVELLATWQAAVLAGVREHRRSLRRTPMDATHYVAYLSALDLGLPRFSGLLWGHIASI